MKMLTKRSLPYSNSMRASVTN